MCGHNANRQGPRAARAENYGKIAEIREVENDFGRPRKAAADSEWGSRVRRELKWQKRFTPPN
ncbi:hypothetical protein PLANPX_2231 [Lacipirellula parvula]|uniref:Uncharacterized protein n=1 Tax=Lacipirellula parvula TaxID=2650471 RepID=A0A5K7XI47_9BACT|nr:hypothetical protein PLANPX_2231 [Lacipirellula parvula]